MMKMEADLPTWFGWVKDNLQAGQKVGLDFTQYPASMLELRFKDIQSKGIIAESSENLVDKVWGDARPARPVQKVFYLEPKYSGMTTQEKYDKVAEKLVGFADSLLITSLDEIAWFLNLRGKDIDFNPVFFSYLIFHSKTKKSDLFIDSAKLSDLP
jgi:Xaa-Pro aminopeptidase